ncbi:MAG: chemotaxis protein CheW [Chlamydiota bacterium]|nr:chemotaxis protein CheW [Chlamydiota bacterium]
MTEGKNFIDNLLFDRTPSQEYREQLTNALREEVDTTDKVVSPFLIFRVQNEWLGLSTSVVKEILAKKKIHTIPHRTNKTLKGTVNIDGQLKLVIGLEGLLEIRPENNKSFSFQDELLSMFIMSQGQDEWVVQSSEILGIRRLNLEKMENIPVTVSKSTANYLKGIFYYDHKHIGLLEEELLFFSLKRAIS